MDRIALPPGLPVGCRFHPTDEELITYYLQLKLLGTDPAVDRVIAEVDFYNFEPWELPDKSKIESKDRMWFFFCRIDYKYANSKRVNRKTKTGFWKITGKERVIKDRTKACIGKKRTLVFHLSSAASGPGERTDWVMHEYFVESDHTFPNQSPYVLCRLKQGNDLGNTPDCNGGEPCGDDVTEVENRVALDPNPLAHGMVQTTIPELGAEGFDDPFAPSNEKVLERLRSQPLYSPPRGYVVLMCAPMSPPPPPPPPPVGFFRRMITSLKSASIPFLTRGRFWRKSQP
ncbi:hypothetical protein TIFTF001_011939 [Ficus carica]|uniref:NAC domain-containing protein n=1 Tax=Ficus carica TaxID=3494 RepID=A0AA88DHZ4_FICCA|nr:hypothetical protein TIFTF001_011939 [Ficus carica]